MMYTCAIKEIKTKFDVLNTEFEARYSRNPINSVHTRLKSTTSIMQKFEKLNLPFNLESLRKDIHDVAGVRVICCYIDDIYEIANALIQQDDIKLIARKDYIANPKPNGYRSLHLIVETPVFFAKHKVDMMVEVQIRTIAMDFWASLEHQLKYKKDIPNSKEIIEQLKNCADVSNQTDGKMLAIRKEIESAQNAPTEEDVLLERISKLEFKMD